MNDLSGTYEFVLKQGQLDFRKRISFGALYGFLQDAAEENALALGFDTGTLLARNLTWMLLRLQLRIQFYPVDRRPILVETWPSGVQSRFAYREFRLKLPEEAEPFAVASSVWLLIDITKGRPVALDSVLSGKLTARTPPMVAGEFPRLRVEGLPSFTCDFRVRLSDLDLNGHVNNVHYAEWLAEAVPEEIWREQSIRELDIEYKKETRYGDIVRLSTHQTVPGEYLHVMRIEGTDQEVLHARSRWSE
jgi:medium-chain acyl-[acyl-carrier-protein] hydrolase